MNDKTEKEGRNQMAAGQGTAGLEGYTGIRQKERVSESAREICARQAYPGISRKAGCRIYTETECGIKNCCFECMKRFACKEFEGGCDKYTIKTYRNCPQIIQEQKGG